VCVAVLVGACGGAKPKVDSSGPGAGGGGTPPPAEAGPIGELDAADGARTPRQPGAALIASERAVWTLEGLLLAEAEAALRSPEARQVLGDPRTLRYSEGAEAKVRKYLRQKRSAQARAAAAQFVASLNRTSLTMLGGVAEQTGLAVEDVLMDYLTYDALYDLAMMRYGHTRWKQGLYTGASKELADSFFSLVPSAPSATSGIKVVTDDPESIEISVFGGRVIERVSHAEVRDVAGVGKVGVVEWTSNYEQLRAGVRGDAARASHTEELEWDGSSFRTNYAVELDEYLSWNATNPWALVLYMTSADEVADMYAGVAAAGGLQAGAGVNLGDLERLPPQGEIGPAKKGLAIRITDAKLKPRLGGVTPRRGQFLVVTVSIKSTLAGELRAPSDWFRLATASTEYPELGVARPAMAPAVLSLAPPGARMLGVPHTAIPAGKTSTLVLVYDVPPDLRLSALLLGANELALKVVVK
jgi:hypothetical protein